jgi:hypothetical protein
LGDVAVGELCEGMEIMLDVVDHFGFDGRVRECGRVLGLFPALGVWGGRGHAAGILDDMDMIGNRHCVLYNSR